MYKPVAPELYLDVATRAEWRAWLRRNYKTAKVVWLVFHKKHTGRPRVAYNDAVEEALAFGWIDSTAHRLDEDRYAQRFTPRRPGSPYSESNLARLRSMAGRGRIPADILAKVRPAARRETRPRPARHPGRHQGRSGDLAQLPGLLGILQADPHRIHRPRPRSPRRIRQAPPQFPENDEEEPPHRLRRHPEALLNESQSIRRASLF